MCDALDLWGQELASSGPQGPSFIRLDGNERLVIPFTQRVVRVKLHYLDLPSLRSYVHCPGRDCFLCCLGRQQETRDLLPVYDPVDKAVGVLSVSTNIRPHALRPQLHAILSKLKEGSRCLVGIRKKDNTQYLVASYPLQENADDGADVIRRFLEQHQAGAIDLRDVYTRLSNAELAALPEIDTLMTMKGIVVK
jgi:hypothetical protein